ncbi:hypothetical protein GGS21DRAFT_488507 [Xylaria nigripes]|nr:hypothetical protein GGS21DRAFT_488507 [Xylaria nigripes]
MKRPKGKTPASRRTRSALPTPPSSSKDTIATTRSKKRKAVASGNPGRKVSRVKNPASFKTATTKPATRFVVGDYANDKTSPGFESNIPNSATRFNVGSFLNDEIISGFKNDNAKTAARINVEGFANSNTTAGGPGGKPTKDAHPAPAQASATRVGPDEAIEKGGGSLKRPNPYALRMGDSWTIHDGTFDPLPLNKRRKRDVPYPTFVDHAFNAMNALSALQLSHRAPVPLTALDIANDHLWKCMPRAARRYLHILAPNGPALWGDCEKSAKIMYEKMEREIYHINKDPNTQEMEYRGYFELKRRPWIIWPLWIEDEWGSDYVTVIWYSTASDEKGDRFDQVVAYAIIDPRRSSKADADERHHPITGRIERIRDRLFEHWRKAGMNAQNAKVMDVRCSPMPFDEATSGERCFAVVKALSNQIIDWYIKGMNFCPKTTITSMQQWVNPFQLRVELTGINAWVLMASLDYDARISVEAILPDTRTEVVADGNKKVLCNYDLAGPYDEPKLASWDYLLPADQKYTAPAESEQISHTVTA